MKWFAFLLLVGCTQNIVAQLQPSPTTVAGTIKIIWSNELAIGKHVIRINPAGDFTWKNTFPTADYYSISHENRQAKVYIEPGDSVNIDWRQNEPVINGTHAELNHALQIHEDKVRTNGNFLDQNNRNVFSRSIEVFNSLIDSLIEVEVVSFGKLKANFQLSTSLDKRLKADIENRKCRYHLLYPGNYNRYTGKIANVPADFDRRLTAGILNEPGLLSSPEYWRMINFFLDLQAVGKFKKYNLEAAPTERLVSRYRAILALPVNDSIKKRLTEQHITNVLSSHSVKNATKLLKLFRETGAHTDMKDRIEKLVSGNLQSRTQADTILAYRTVHGFSLEAHLFRPKDTISSEKSPVYLFFHGGGWATGKPEWGYENCKTFAAKGFVAISFEYRLRHVLGTSIAESVNDAFHAVGWVKQNAEHLKIDTSRIIIAGFSAGAHLAASCATLDAKSIAGKEIKFSPKPFAIILQSAPYSVERRDVINARVKPQLISPLAHLDQPICPVLAFHGQYDELVNVSEFNRFVALAKKSGTNIHYKLFENRGHFFYDPDAFRVMNEMTDAFIKDLKLFSNTP